MHIGYNFYASEELSVRVYMKFDQQESLNDMT